MDDEKQDKLIANFLKDSLFYLENRIHLVDNKASILIAIQGGLFALLTWVSKELFLTDTTPAVNYGGIVFIVIDFIIMIITVLLLIQTIRPGKHFFSPEVPVDRPDMKSYVMWLDKDQPSNGWDRYQEKILSLDTSTIRMNYEKAHYVTLQLVRRKYTYYRWATVSMKVMIAVSVLGIVILSLIKLAS